MSPEERNAAIDAWMAARHPGKEVTNAELISLLSLLPPDSVPKLEDTNGIYQGTALVRRFLSVGEKSFRLYIDGYIEAPSGREPE